VPEGDTVYRTAKELHGALAGRVLTRSDFRLPRYATADLTGRVVREVVPRGKHLMTRVDGNVTVHTHLKMEGKYRISRPSGYPPGDHRVRLVLANDEWQAVGYQLGIVEVVRTDREDRVTGHLGPDLLGPDWDQDEAVRRLLLRPERPIGEALLDQSNLAGIGNLYKAEVLFLRKVNPGRPVGAVDDLGALVELARQLLEANKDRVSQITTGRDLRGQETWVYGRPHRPCRVCGRQILTEKNYGPAAPARERITFWCPTCQA
jgi:endonuclease-8